MIHIHQCTFLAQGNSVWENGSTISVNRVKQIIAKKLEALDTIPGSVRLKKLTLDLGEFETLSFNNEFIERLEQSCQDLESKLRELQRAQMAGRHAQEKEQLDQLIAFLYSLEYTREVQNMIFLLESTGLAPRLEEWEAFVSKYARTFGGQPNLKLSKSLRSMLRSSGTTPSSKALSASKGKKKDESDDAIEQRHIDFLVESLDRIPMNTRWFETLDEIFLKKFGSKLPIDLYNRIRKTYDSFEFQLDDPHKKPPIQLGEETEVELNKELLDFFESLDDTEEIVWIRKQLKQKSINARTFFFDVLRLYKEEFGKKPSKEFEEQLIRFQQTKHPISWAEIDPALRQRIVNKLTLLKEINSSNSTVKKKSNKTDFTEEQYAFLCNQLNELSIDVSWYSRLLSNYQNKFNTAMPENLRAIFLRFSQNLLEVEKVSVLTKQSQKPSVSDFADIIRTLEPSSRWLPFFQSLEEHEFEFEADFLFAYRSYFGNEIEDADLVLLKEAQKYLLAEHFRRGIEQNREQLQELLSNPSHSNKTLNRNDKSESIFTDSLASLSWEELPLNINWLSEISNRFRKIHQRNLPRKKWRKLMRLVKKLHDEAKTKSTPTFIANHQLSISELRKQLNSRTDIPDSKELARILPTDESAQAFISFNELIAGFSAFYGREVSLALKQAIWNNNKNVLSDDVSSGRAVLKTSVQAEIDQLFSSEIAEGFSFDVLKESVKTFLIANPEFISSESKPFSIFQHHFEARTGQRLPNSRKLLFDRLWKEIRAEKDGETQHDFRSKELINLDKKTSNLERRKEHDTSQKRLNKKSKSSGVLHPDFVRPAIDFILNFLDQASLSKNWVEKLIGEFEKSFDCAFPDNWQSLLNRYTQDQVLKESFKSKLLYFLSENLEMPGAEKLLHFLSKEKRVDSLETLFEQFENDQAEALPIGLKMMLFRWLKTIDDSPTIMIDLAFPMIRQELIEWYEEEQSFSPEIKTKLIKYLSQENDFKESEQLLNFVLSLEVFDSLNALFNEFENQYNIELPTGLKSLLREQEQKAEEAFKSGSEISFPSIRQDQLETKIGTPSQKEFLKSELITLLSNENSFEESGQLLNFLLSLEDFDSLNTLFNEFENQYKIELPSGLKSLLREQEQKAEEAFKSGSEISFPSIRQSQLETKIGTSSQKEFLKSELITLLSNENSFEESGQLLNFLLSLDDFDSLNALFNEFENQDKIKLPSGLKSLLHEQEQRAEEAFKSGSEISFPSIRQSQVDKGTEAKFRASENDIKLLHKRVDHFFERTEQKQEEFIQFLHFMLNSVPLDACWLPTVEEKYKHQFNREIPSELFNRLLRVTNVLSDTLDSEDSKGSKLTQTNTNAFDIGRISDTIPTFIFTRLKQLFDEQFARKRSFSITDFLEEYERRYHEELPQEVTEKIMKSYAQQVKFNWKLLPLQHRKELIESIKSVLAKEGVDKISSNEFNKQLTFLIRALERTSIDASWFVRIRNAYNAEFDTHLPADLEKCLLNFSEKMSFSVIQKEGDSKNAQLRISEKSPNDGGSSTDEKREFHHENRTNSTFDKEVDFYLESKQFLSSKWEQLRAKLIDLNQVRREYSERFNAEIPSAIFTFLESTFNSNKETGSPISIKIDQFLRKNGTNEQVTLLTTLIQKTAELTQSNWFESILSTHKSEFGSPLPLDVQGLLLRFANQKNTLENQEEKAEEKLVKNEKNQQIVKWRTFIEKTQARSELNSDSERLIQLDFVSNWLTKSLLTRNELALLEMDFQRQFRQLLPPDWKNELQRISEHLQKQFSPSKLSKSENVLEQYEKTRYKNITANSSESTPESQVESIHNRLKKHISASSLSTEKKVLIELVNRLSEYAEHSWFQQLIELYKADKNTNMPATMQGVLLAFMQKESEGMIATSEEKRTHKINEKVGKSAMNSEEQQLEEFLSKSWLQKFGKIDSHAFVSHLLEINFDDLQNLNQSFQLWFGRGLPYSLQQALDRLNVGKNDLKTRLLSFLRDKNLKEIVQLVQSTKRLTTNDWVETLDNRCRSKFGRSISVEEQKVLLSFAANDEFTILSSDEASFDSANFDPFVKDVVQYVKSNKKLLNGLNERYSFIKEHSQSIRGNKSLNSSDSPEDVRLKFQLYFNQRLNSKDLDSMIQIVDQFEKKRTQRISRSRLRPSKPAKRKMISNKIKLIRLREELKAIKEGKKVEESTIVTNAGLVFGWVLWKSIFDGFSWLEEGRFIHSSEKDSAMLAANWLHYSVGETETVNPLILFICGLDEERFERFTEEELEEEMNGQFLTDSIQGYYEMLLSMWPIFALEQLSDFIELFVEREALLLESPVGMKLKLVKEPIDALTDKHPLPWPISMVNFSWTSQIIEVEW